MNQLIIKEKNIWMITISSYLYNHLFFKTKIYYIVAIPVILILQGMPKGASPTVPVVPPHLHAHPKSSFCCMN
jgi:hypothetical protein